MATPIARFGGNTLKETLDNAETLWMKSPLFTKLYSERKNSSAL